ncbi:hypothetical protein RUM43_002720 [Polyplax serrata]|uniref:Sensory neuron membrane protein 2 n=1 Tax=Polyplax serrata TaxID=468196 RepID=A0AAN8PD76_POLSC
MADPSYALGVKGLQPDKNKHQSFLSLEPNTGYPLAAGSRIQINIFLQKIKEVDLMKNLPDSLLPAVWVDESVLLTDALIDQIDTELLQNLKIIDIVRWLILGVGTKAEHTDKRELQKHVGK